MNNQKLSTKPVYAGQLMAEVQLAVVGTERATGNTKYVLLIRWNLA